VCVLSLGAEAARFGGGIAGGGRTDEEGGGGGGIDATPGPGAHSHARSRGRQLRPSCEDTRSLHGASSLSIGAYALPSTLSDVGGKMAWCGATISREISVAATVGDCAFTPGPGRYEVDRDEVALRASGGVPLAFVRAARDAVGGGGALEPPADATPGPGAYDVTEADAARRGAKLTSALRLAGPSSEASLASTLIAQRECHTAGGTLTAAGVLALSKTSDVAGAGAASGGDGGAPPTPGPGAYPLPSTLNTTCAAMYHVRAEASLTPAELAELARRAAAGEDAPVFAK
jgi:hypothetical protein